MPQYTFKRIRELTSASSYTPTETYLAVDAATWPEARRIALSAFRLASDPILLAALESIDPNTILGRASTSGVPVALSAETVRSILNVENGAEANNLTDAQAAALISGGNTTLHYHAADRDRANHTGTQPASTITGLGALALLNEVETNHIANGAVTNAKLAAMSGNTLKGRLGASGAPQDIARETLTEGAAEANDFLVAFGGTGALKAIRLSNIPGYGGEANTATNIGTVGYGLFHAKSGVQLQFRNLAVSGPLDIAYNTGTQAIVLSPVVGQNTGTLAAGDDNRFPTSAQKAALVGTHGTPGDSNRYVTNSDPRLSDARTPTAHTHVIADITNAGVLASLNTVGTAHIGDGAVTNAKLAAASAYTIKGNPTATTAAVTDIAKTTLSEKTNPSGGDKLLGWDGNGALRLFDVANLPTAGSGEANTASNVGTEGVGVFHQKTGINLEFRNVAPGDTGVGVAYDGTTKTVRIFLNYGQTANTVAAGDDSRFPTSAQKAALAGTNGTPSDSNRYVTNSDPRLSDARAPTAHTHVIADITNAGALASLNTVSTTHISDGAVTLTKLANISGYRLLGRGLATSGVVQELDINAFAQNNSPTSGDKLVGYKADGTLVVFDVANIGGGGSGEANTASNIGTTGVGVFHAKSGVDLQFRRLYAASSRISVSLNNDRIDFDVIASAISLNDLAGTLSNSKLDAMAQATVKGRATGAGTGSPQDLTASQLVQLLNTHSDSSGAVGLNVMPPWQALTYGATVTFNGSTARWADLVLSGNATLSPTNIQRGQIYALRIRQDATGGRALTWSSEFKWKSSTGLIRTAANATSYFLFVGDENNELHEIASDPNAYVVKQSLTDGATITWDLSKGHIAEVTLGGNRSLTVSNINRTGTAVLIVKQDATGGRTLSYSSAIKWPGGTAPTLSTNANAVDVLTFLVDATTGTLYGSILRAFA